MIILLCFVGFIIFVIILTSSLSEKKPNKSVSVNETIDLEVPNPIVYPEKFLHFINKTNKDYLWQIEQNLDYTGNLKNIVLRKALNEKSSTGSLNLEYYLKILSKIKADTLQIESLESDIQEDYKFATSFKIAGAFLKNRKENLIYNVEEGSEVILKREPNNKFDNNAIVITQNNQVLGYVPRIETDLVSELIKNFYVAKIADIIYDNDFIDVIVNIYKSAKENKDPQYFLDNETILEYRQKKIESKYLRPKKDAEDENMFYKRKVVITGDFVFFIDRNDLALLLYNSGADIDTGITEKIHYIIVGKNPGWRKIEKAEEFGIMTFNEDEIRKILNV